jgi:murein DD-endopeptidase MepM/ murein hydrolase activator NlpD
MNAFLSAWKNNRFGIVSWGLTIAIIASLAGGAFWWKNSQKQINAYPLQPTAESVANENPVELPLPSIATSDPSIGREVHLDTNIPADLPRYAPVTYIVQRGDSLSAIADKFGITIETILYNNKNELNDDAHSLRPGMNLLIPPVDGLYYTWKEGDTIEKVAGDFKAEADAIIEFPGNEIDLVNPDEIKPGTIIMIPGGKRDLIDRSIPVLPGSTCGTVGAGSFIWPVAGEPQTLSGNSFSAGHLGVDMTAIEGDVVLAADSGVVTFAGWSQYGYGNMIQIDHCNGYTTIYAHLNAIFVAVGQSVGQGSQIGTAGNTGNSFGAHLHFEIRLGGAAVNPLDYLY